MKKATATPAGLQDAGEVDGEVLEGPKSGVRYLNIDVLTAARQRIRHVFEIFDHVMVAFSGGKDSLVTLHLALEYWKESGRPGKLPVIFRDEELIPDPVIDFVNGYREHPLVDLRYYAVPLKSEKFILGKTYEYTQWDEQRGREGRWLRPKPAHAITDSGGRVMDQYTMDAFCVQGLKGKVAIMTGVRADESLVRFRSCVNKKSENYINATAARNVHLVKPIYDWSQKDVFKFLCEQGIPYCPIYDAQLFNGEQMRVSTPLHAEHSKKLNLIRTRYPIFYQQIIDIFPEMKQQARYWDEFSTRDQIDQYEHSWRGILRYIEDNIPAEKRALAIKRVLDAKTIRENGKFGAPPFYGYPILYVFKCILNGQYKRVIQPKKNPTREDIEYEQPSANPSPSSTPKP